MNPEMEKYDRESKLSVNHFFLTAFFDICLDEAIALSNKKRTLSSYSNESFPPPFFQHGVFIVCFQLVVDINKWVTNICFQRKIILSRIPHDKILAFQRILHVPGIRLLGSHSAVASTTLESMY